MQAGCADHDIEKATRGVSGDAPESPEPPDAPEPLFSLAGVEPPLPDLSGIVVDQQAAILLGKALFWDQQAGSDGLACASCHFHAGADIRLTNQLNPGILSGDIDFGAIAPMTRFGETASGAVADSNYSLVREDYPFHQLQDPDDRSSPILISTNDVASSQGAFRRTFVDIVPGSAEEACAPADASIFHTEGYAARQVEPRNTPTMINAVYFFRNFWDGRANNVFNGVDPFGLRSSESDPRTRILVRQADGTVALQAFAIDNASLASQAVGPPLSALEMSCAGRSFPILGRKLLALEPLAQQRVHRSDSVLGPFRDGDGRGLAVDYGALIQQAFHPRYWGAAGTWRIDAGGTLRADPDGFTHEELNFSLFWGISIMLYEATLVSDETRFDRYVGCESPHCEAAIAPDPTALTAQEQQGLEVFTGKGLCIDCHNGPELSSAASRLQAESREGGLLERMPLRNGPAALYDSGFYNIGVRPTAEDPGVGDVDPFGMPLSFTRQYLDMLRGQHVPDPFHVDPCTFEVPFSHDLFPGSHCLAEPNTPAQIDNLRVAVDGAFKVPGLRNVGLTPPYFHNGGTATLADVVAFYDRGGDRRGTDRNDTTGTGPLGRGGTGGSNLSADITPLGLADEEQSALVAFLLALTDARVACEQAPFDHPSLMLPTEYLEADADGDGMADEVFVEIPAIGAAGREAQGFACIANTGSLFDMRILGF